MSDIKKAEPLAPHTTYKIGGPADYFLTVQNQAELISAVVSARNSATPYFILGTGANILFGDKGFRGLVIKNEARGFSFNGNVLTAESGAIIEDLIQESAERNLSGLEHFAGIPSTVGGAVWQNLHFLSPDRSRTVFIEEIFVSAKVLTEDNQIVILDKESFKFGYDSSILHDRNLVVTEVVFNLTPMPKEKILEQVQENLKWRNSKQPQLAEYPSCGSVFKKIDGVGAGRLIEQVGLKGHRIGGIQSSLQHANFLVNTGKGTAAEVATLIKLIQEKVKQETGYELETEISLVGEF